VKKTRKTRRGTKEHDKFLETKANLWRVATEISPLGKTEKNPEEAVLS